MAFHTLFPTYVYRDRLASGGGANARAIPRLLRELTDEAKILSEIDIDGQEWSAKNYLNGFTSYGSLDSLHSYSPTFASLAKVLAPHVRRFSKKQHWDLQGGRLELVSMWVNIMPPGAVHSLHLHPLSVVSGTVYLSVPKGTSPIKFEDPRLDRFMAQPPRLSATPPNLRPFYLCEPKAGDVILFDSWLRHEVPQVPQHVKSSKRKATRGQNRSLPKENRISVSFNFDWF